MKKLFLTLMFFALLPFMALAQSPQVVAMAQSELQKRGLTEAEVRARLLQEGIDVDNIQPSEYASYQGRVTAILDQMQAEKASKSSTSAASSANEVETPAEVPQTTVGEAAAEAALEEALADNGVSPTAGNDIYGHGLFTGKSLDVFRTTDGAQAPSSYVLGEGDEVHISIFGSSQTEIHQRIGSDGSIQPTGSTKIFLKGMTLAQGRDAIINKLSQYYSFRPDQIAVTITTARTVTVGIYGEVGVQGGFTLSALNTAFNALVAAGGPTSLGSVRNIQMSRGGRTTRLDIYKYMTNPNMGQQYDLQNGDVIFVPIAQKIVTIQGAVNRPMRYELIEGEGLKELINYAGGLTWNVYPNFVQIERVENGEVMLLEYNLRKITEGNQKVTLHPGDVIRIKHINQPLEDFVTVGGNVYYGGRFDLKDRMTVKQAIDNAGGLKPTAYPVAYIVRPDITNRAKVEYIPINLDTEGETLLQPGDHLNIYDNATFTNVGEVRVSGAVKNPLGVTYDPSLTVHDLLTMAGGFEVGAAFDHVEVFRVNISNYDAAELETIILKVDRAYNVVDNPSFQLHPFDHLVVRMTPNFTTGRYVEVNGRVKYPGVYVLNDGKMQLSEVIKLAGGLLDDADPYVRLFRTNARNTGPIGIDLRKVKTNKGNINGDPILMSGDVINILRQENTVAIRATGTRMNQYVMDQNVTASGQKTFVYQGGHNAKWYIKHFAGGFEKYADRNSVTVTLPNNQTESTKHFLFFRTYPKVEPGSVVSVNINKEKQERIEKPKEKIDWAAETSRMLATITSVLSIILLVNSISTMNHGS